MDRWQNIDQAWDTGKPPPPPPRSLILPLPASLTLSSLSGHAEFSVYTALSRKERADYYSVAIKSQFGAERLCGHLKGHNTRQIISPIEMDGTAEVGPKCPCRSFELSTNRNYCPLWNIDAPWMLSCHSSTSIWTWFTSSVRTESLRWPFQFIWAQSGKTI